MAIIENIEDVKLPQVYEQLHDEDLDLPQVHNMFFADQLKQPYDEGLYLSPIDQWIEPSYAYSSCPNIDSFFYPNNLMFQFSLFHE